MVLIKSKDPDDCSDIVGINGRLNAWRDDVEVKEEVGDGVNELTLGTENRTNAMIRLVRLLVGEQWTAFLLVAGGQAPTWQTVC